MKFVIEQIALCPPNPEAAIEFLKQLGLEIWVHDHVLARGGVFAVEAENEADLAFNYDASPDNKPLELEVLHYTDGANWMQARKHPSVSHLGMHCTDDELVKWREKFDALGIAVAQEVFTEAHTNPAISGTRWYQYVIFDTHAILGVDLKFIVRREAPGAP